MRGELATHYLTEQHQNTMNALVCGHFGKLRSNQNTTSDDMDLDTQDQITTTMVIPNDENSSSPLEDMFKTVEILTGGIQTLNDDNQRLNEQSLHSQIQREELHKYFTGLKSSIEEEDIFLHGLKPNQDILSQDVASLKQNVEDLQSISYDGTLIWKITSVREKMSNTSRFPFVSFYGNYDVDLTNLKYFPTYCFSSGCTIGATNLHLFTTFLLLSNWI